MNEQPRTILLADSQIDEVTALKLAVESGFPDAKVITADRGDRALALAEERPLRAVIADMRLSDMSGLKLLMKLKARHPQVVALMMSDADSQRAEAICREAGIDGFLEKPLSISRLQEQLGGVGKDKGAVFRGTLEQFSVPEVLQLMADREPPMLMRVDCEQGQGSIELVGGEVVHARVNGKIGEQAFFELVSWHRGHFEVVDVLWPEERTIARPLQQILMLAAAKEHEQREERAREEIRREKKTEAAPSFFDASESPAPSSSVWENMSGYKRPHGAARTSARPLTVATMAAMPAFAAYYQERGGGTPLRFKAKESRPPPPPEPNPAETAPRAPAAPGPQRRPLRLPSARRVLLASALAAFTVMVVAHVSGLFSVNYARDFAPAFMDLVHDIVPGADRPERAERRSGSERSAANRPGQGIEINNRQLRPAGDPQQTTVVTAAPVAPEAPQAVPWVLLEVGIRDDERLSGVNHVGVRGDLFDRLQLGENPWVDLRCEKGRRMGGFAVRMEDSPEPLVLTRSMARGFGYGLEDLHNVRLRPVEWARSAGQSVSFETQRELPGRFCSYWYSVGLSLQAMQQAGLTPGDYAVVRGPQGLQTVRVQLVDRGRADEVWLSKPVRDAVDGAEGGGAITLFPRS